MIMNLNTLKKSIEKSNIEEAANNLKKLYMEKPEKFRKAILIGNVLPYPFNSDFDRIKQNLNNFKDSYILASEKLRLEEKVDIEYFLIVCNELFTIVDILSTNYSSNCESLSNNNFFDYKFSSKLQLLCVFKEEYDRQGRAILNNNVYKEKKFNASIGLVGNINQIDSSRISYDDQSEFIIEAISEIFKYIFHLKKKSEDELNSKEYDGKFPIKNEELKEIFFLGQHRLNLMNIWGKVKYSQWSYETIKDKNEIFYKFVPSDMISYKKYRASVIRNQNRFYVNYMKAARDHFNGISKASILIKNLSKKIDLLDIDSLFTFDNNVIKEIASCYSGLVNAELIRIKKVFGDELLELRIGENKEIKISEYLEMYNFLDILSRILSDQLNKDSYNSITDYRLLVPKISILKIASKFSEVFSCSLEKAMKILDLFILKPDSKLDLFSQPLVQCDDSRILFTPSLVSTMNISRAIECQLSFWKIDVSDKGIIFEENIRKIISSSPYIEVNKNDIKFEAYDGKTVQFDFLAFFDNYIILIEDKCIYEPFSEKEIYDTLKKEIKGSAFKQLNRREDILINDWDKVRKNCDINLPMKPPKSNQIIKIACVNMLNYSGQVIDGIIITDYITLTNYFMSPFIEKSEIQAGKTNKSEFYNVWKKGYPTINELKEYLMMPVAISNIYSNLRECFHNVPIIKESDYRIACLDLYMGKNIEIEDLKIKNATGNIQKVGRNDSCPCGRINVETGKVVKYKKCCGRKL